MAGFKKSVEVLPAILVSSIVFSGVQFLVSNYINPMLPGILAGLTTIVCLTIFLKYWKPKSIWRFKEEPQQTIETELKYSTSQIVRAWSPFIIMTLLIVAWGMQPVKDALNSIFQLKFYIPGLHDAILKPDGSILNIKPFDFNIISNAGSATLLAAIISLPLIGMNIKNAGKIFLSTLDQLKFPIITIASIVGFAFLANNSGMAITMALALASTGILFPFFSPILGWLGVFLTGSDTSSNALFSKLQYTSAQTIGVDPLLTVSANCSGGITGKMISPQSLAVGAASVGLVGRESELFRFTLKHSFILLFFISVITVLQAYVFQWMIPTYKLAEVTIANQVSDISQGFLYLLILGFVVGIFMISVFLRNRK